MTNAAPSVSPVLHEIHVKVVSAEEASLGVAEFWSGDRMIVVLGAHALAEDLAEANRLLALY
jgi:hypothetical protein